MKPSAKPILISLLTACATALGLSSAWASVTVSPQQIESKVREQVLHTFPLEDQRAKLQVELLRLPQETLTLRGEHVTILAESSPMAVVTYRTIVQVTLTTEDEVRHLGVPVQIKVEKPVWVAKHLIRAKQAIGAQDVMLETRRMDYDAAFSLGADENITAYTSRTNLTPGSIVDARKVSRTPWVYQNDDVSLVIAMPNGVHITVIGKALENGAKGDRIRVRQVLADRRSKVFTGHVTGKNIVTVDL